jgi:DNA-binding response OmpR family regulator
MQIAVLEHDASHAELLTHWLKLAGHRPQLFNRGADLLAALDDQIFGLTMLDWSPRDMESIDVLDRVRGELGLQIPILFNTVRDQQMDIVLALRRGADDYIVKPARRLELLARIEALTRRTRGTPQPQFAATQIGCFRVDSQNRTVERDGEPVKLTAKDFGLAALFLANAGRLLSRRHIEHVVWPSNANLSSRTLDTHVCRVRAKLRLFPEFGWRLTAVYSHGYRLDRLKPPAAAPVMTHSLVAA